MSGAAITLEALGLSPEDIADRVVDQIVDRLLKQHYTDDQDSVHTTPSPFAEAMKKRIIERIDKAIEEIAGRNVLPNVASYVENLCLQETSSWGEKKGEAVTFTEYLVKRAEAYLVEKVDSQGKDKASSGSYSRLITLHHDGHGLNESIKLTADDEPDGSGASHRYTAINAEGSATMYVQFQKGPRGLPSSIPGVTEAVVLAVLIDRLEGFQAGPFACPDNVQTLMHLRRALSCTKERADERASRGVLGKNER